VTNFNAEVRKTSHKCVIAQLQKALGIETDYIQLDGFTENKLVEIRDFLVVKYNEEVKND